MAIMNFTFFCQRSTLKSIYFRSVTHIHTYILYFYRNKLNVDNFSSSIQFNSIQLDHLCSSVTTVAEDGSKKQSTDNNKILIACLRTTCKHTHIDTHTHTLLLASRSFQWRTSLPLPLSVAAIQQSIGTCARQRTILSAVSISTQKVLLLLPSLSIPLHHLMSKLKSAPNQLVKIGKENESITT